MPRSSRRLHACRSSTTTGPTTRSQRSNALKKLLVRPPVPRGVYLWGDVGRGKSFLMDAFFATVPLIRKTRVHFHEFMRGVHAELHDLKGTADPLDEVALRVARRHRLICFDEFHVSDIADAMILYRLLDRLFALNIGFVITSNYAPDALYPDGLHRDRMLPAIELLKQRLDSRACRRRRRLPATGDGTHRGLHHALGRGRRAHAGGRVRARCRSRGRRPDAGDRGSHAARAPTRWRCGLVRLCRPVRWSALAERLPRDCRAVPHRRAFQRAADVGRPGIGSASLHVAGRCPLRPPREAAAVGRGARRRNFIRQVRWRTNSPARCLAWRRCNHASTSNRRAGP